MEKLNVRVSSGHTPALPAVQGARKVLLVDADPERHALLRRGLEGCGYELVSHLRQVEQLLKRVEDHNPDVLVIGADAPDDVLLQQLCAVRELGPRPVILFAERESPELIERTVQAGVHAFVVSEIPLHRLTSIIDIATARFTETMALQQELARVRTQLADRRVVDRAKGLLMQEHGMSEEQAYRALRKMSMDKGLSLAAVANTIVDVLSLFDAGKT